MDEDFVSDLNDGTAVDDTVSAHTGSVDPNRVEATPKEPVQKTDTQSAPKAKAPSLRDQISTALKGEEVTPPAAQQDGGPARNPDGTFAPKPADAAAAADPAQQVQQSGAPVATPPGFTPQEAEVFAKLPAELQTSVARTMESLNEKATRFAGYEQMEQLIAPRRQSWALNGMTEAQAVNQLLALSDFAAQKPMEFIQYFAQQRGLDLEELVFGAEPVDPTVQALQQQVHDLNAQLNGMSTQQQQAAHQNTVNEIVAFASETGPDGKPLRPYFEELGDGVLPFIQAVMAQNPGWSRQQILQEAYDRACWGTPAVRAKLQQATTAAAEAARIQEQQANAKRARSAGASIPSGVPATAPSAAASGARSLRDEIRANLSAAS